MTKTIKVLGQGWVLLATLVIVASYGMIWWKDGFWALADILSPWNVINFVAVLVTLAPGLLLIYWADRRRASGK